MYVFKLKIIKCILRKVIQHLNQKVNAVKQTITTVITTAGFLLAITAQQLVSTQQQCDSSLYHLRWWHSSSQLCGKNLMIPLLPSKPLLFYINESILTLKRVMKG